MRRPKAIIFDMDGVIVDSMPYHYIAWYEALREFGVRVTAFDVYAKEGERWDKSLKDFLSRAGSKPTPALLKKIFALRQKIFRKYFKRHIFKDVPEFLNCLKFNHYKLGLVTGTPIGQVNSILPKSIRGFFQVIVAGDQVKKGKPHPEPYLQAAKKLELKPEECVVVENAPFGIESAKKAGMFCIAITTSLPEPYLKQADMVVGRLEDITGVIEKTCKV